MCASIRPPGAETALGKSDRSEIGFVFADAPESELREVKFDSIGNLTFEILPGHERWKVGAARVYPVETDILAIWPHAHLRAVAVRYDAFYPDGTSELLLDVPNYARLSRLVVCGAD